MIIVCRFSQSRESGLQAFALGCRDRQHRTVAEWVREVKVFGGGEFSRAQILADKRHVSERAGTDAVANIVQQQTPQRRLTITGTSEPKADWAFEIFSLPSRKLRNLVPWPHKLLVGFHAHGLVLVILGEAIIATPIMHEMNVNDVIRFFVIDERRVERAKVPRVGRPDPQLGEVVAGRGRGPAHQVIG